MNVRRESIYGTPKLNSEVYSHACASLAGACSPRFAIFHSSLTVFLSSMRLRPIAKPRNLDERLLFSSGSLLSRSSANRVYTHQPGFEDPCGVVRSLARSRNETFYSCLLIFFIGESYRSEVRMVTPVSKLIRHRWRTIGAPTFRYGRSFCCTVGGSDTAGLCLSESKQQFDNTEWIHGDDSKQ